MPLKNMISAEQAIETAVEFTDSTAAEQIRRSFSGALREMQSTDDIVFLAPIKDPSRGVNYVVRYADLSRSADSIEFSRELQEGAPWFTPDCMLSIHLDGRKIIKWKDSVLLLQPVIQKERISEIVCLRADHFDRENMSIVAGFVRLYRNFVSLKTQGELDPLTGLLNRRTLDSRLAEMLRDSAAQDRRPETDHERREQTDTTRQFLAILDIDHFKRINDTLGHLFGDEVIVRTAQEMRIAFRQSDLLFRYGGEEFVVAMTCHSAEEAMRNLNRFRQNLQAIEFSQIGTVTISAGFTQIETAALPAALVARADQALYHAKGNGRNQVVYYEQLVESGELNTAVIEHNELELF